MNRLLSVLTLLLFVAFAAAPAPAELKKGDKKNLHKYIGIYMDPFADDDDRQGALEQVTKIFTKNPSGLSDVMALFAVMQDCGERKARGMRTGRINDGAFTLADYGIQGSKENLRFSYALSLPKKYSGGTKDDAWPMILCIPDKGMSPEAYLEKYWGDKALRDQYVIAALGFKYDDIEIVTQDTVKEGEEVKIVEKREKVPFRWDSIDARSQFWRSLWKLQVKELKLNPNRIILDGAGMGSSGVLNFAVGSAWRFGGIIVRGGALESEAIANLSTLPVAVIKGAADGDEATKTVQALRKATAETKNLTELDGGNAAAMLAWLDGCTRNRFPLPSRWVAAAPADQFGYWTLITERHDPKLPAEVTIGAKQEGKVEITAKNVREMRLFLNDLLVDMDSSIEVVVNGKSIQTVNVDRTVEDLLGHAFCWKGGMAPYDPGCVFTGEIRSIQIPAEEKEKEGDGD